jgi:hypothetical protein
MQRFHHFTNLKQLSNSVPLVPFHSFPFLPHLSKVPFPTRRSVGSIGTWKVVIRWPRLSEDQRITRLWIIDNQIVFYCSSTKIITPRSLHWHPTRFTSGCIFRQTTTRPSWKDRVHYSDRGCEILSVSLGQISIQSRWEFSSDSTLIWQLNSYQ